MSTDIAAYFGLFAAAFMAATIVPAQSESLLVFLLLTSDYSTYLLVAAASFGNVLGSVVNWGLGRGIERLRDRRWFPVSAGRLQAAERWYGRYGKWSLLASWVPIIGDPITVVAGVLKVPLATFVPLVALAKVDAMLFWRGRRTDGHSLLERAHIRRVRPFIRKAV